MIIPRTVHLATQVLPALAGAFTDQDFFDMPIGTSKLVYYITYTRGGAAGRPIFHLIWGNILTDPGGGEESRALVIDGSVALVIGADGDGRFNVQTSEPQGPTASAEIQYVIECCCIPGGSRKSRLLASEQGNQGAPGTIAITLTGSN